MTSEIFQISKSQEQALDKRLNVKCPSSLPKAVKPQAWFSFANLQRFFEKDESVEDFFDINRANQ